MEKPQKLAVMVVAAIGRNRELGKNNELIWKIPDDLKRFKQLTTGHPVILGRKTYESIFNYLGHPLPDRTNIVVTRDPTAFVQTVLDYPNVVAVNSIEEALEEARETDQSETYIGGGTQIFEQAMPFTTKLCLTLVDAEDGAADSFFPEYEKDFTKKVFEEERDWNGLKYRWIDLERA